MAGRLQDHRGVADVPGADHSGQDRRQMEHFVDHDAGERAAQVQNAAAGASDEAQAAVASAKAAATEAKAAADEAKGRIDEAAAALKEAKEKVDEAKEVVAAYESAIEGVGEQAMALLNAADNASPFSSL